MMWPAKIESAELPEHGRIAVISDIHGNLPYLRALLDKLALTEEDTLVFCGDMVEKVRPYIIMVMETVSNSAKNMVTKDRKKTGRLTGRLMPKGSGSKKAITSTGRHRSAAFATRLAMLRVNQKR